ncbi:MAG: response regulator [Methylococcaceae bacterium]
MPQQTPSPLSDTPVENRPAEQTPVKATVSDDALSAWQQQNQRLIAAAQQRLSTLISPQAEKIPESAHEVTKIATPAIDKLSDNQIQASIIENIALMQQFAKQAADVGYYCLQDVCLLVIESLDELLSDDHKANTEIGALLKQLPPLIESYTHSPLTATQAIITILRKPVLDFPLSDEEFILFEKLLLAENTPPLNQQTQSTESLSSTISDELSDVTVADIAEPTTKPISTELLTMLEELADKAAVADCYGFQDSCLLIVEALREQPNVSLELLALLEHYPEVFTAYQNKQDSEQTGKQILAVLHHPDLSLSLSDDEFEALEASILFTDTQATDSVTKPVQVSIPVIDTPAPESSPSPVTISRDTQELVDLLLLETATVNSRLQNLIIDNPVHVQEELEQLSEELQRFANAAKMADFDGLAHVCVHVTANVRHFSQHSSQFDSAELTLLREWTDIVKAYLLVFYEDTAVYPLLAQLSRSDWPIPLANETGAAILKQLQNTRPETVAPAVAPRKQIAEVADVSLALPDDVNRELLDLLLQELPNQTQQFSQAMQHLKAGGSMQDVTLAQRVAHTIKGSGNTVGIKGIAVLTHHLEDILTACANAHTLPSQSLLNALIIAADCLEAMSEALLGSADAPDDAQAVLQNILDWTNQIDGDGLPSNDEQIPQPRPVALANDEHETDKTAAKTTAPAVLETQEAMVRVPSSQIENLFRLSGESIILNGQTYERQRRLKIQLQALEEQFALLYQLETELEQMIDLKDLSGRSSKPQSQDFDSLELDQYNELHTASRRMVEASVDAREIGQDMKKELEFMSEVLEYQQRLVIETQESIMQTRLVAVASIVPRLQRALRQTCRLIEKQCDLSISGEALLIDGDTLNALVDPLMHLLRNAVDHGIEAQEEQRRTLGKPSNGQIHISFDREGNTILVSVRDDGQGLDFDAIRAVAQQRGLLSVNQNISEEELKAFILHPNFSTRSYSTQTSGRGVGMEAAHSQVLALGGGLTLHSRRGKGLTVEMRVPLPLSRSHALLANVGVYKVAIASKGLTQIIYFGSGELKTLSNEQVLIIGDDIYPMVKLNELLHIQEHRHEDRSYQHGAVLLVANENKIIAVLVDQITDSRDVVIKNLGYYMRKIPGFIGATILGDGTVTPVLDIPELLRSPSGARNMDSVAVSVQPSTFNTNQPLALIVEDSLSQRRALEQILADAGYRVRIARDGVEAAELLVHIQPSIVLTDLEMPRMNGIELTSHIRSQASIKKLPIIMITSRTTQKHQQLAEEAGINFYFTKPVSEDDLLNKVNQLIHDTGATTNE